jgi:hypothetical protein
MASGTIAYCSREDQVYPGFAASLARLCQRHPDATVVQIVTNDIADGRNKAVMQAEGEWLWFIDTDMLFAPTTLERLLAHEVDVVQVLCLKRHPPHEPIVWEDSPTAMSVVPRGSPRLIEVQSLGAGGTLYRRTVFESMPGPWFEGILGVEDTNFAAKCKAKGFKLYVDMATPVGHTTPMVIWPVYDAASMAWSVRYDAMNGQNVTLPFPSQSQIVRPVLRAVK